MLDVACSYTHAIVKTRNKDEKLEFYGIDLAGRKRDETLKRFGGAQKATPVYKEVIYKIDIDAASVTSFAMTHEATLFLT